MENRIKAARIFYSNVAMALICLAFVPFAFGEIWLIFIVIALAIAGFLFSIYLLKLDFLGKAAAVHLISTAYVMAFLHLFISNSYSDTLTFICISFIFVVDSLLVSTSTRQIIIFGSFILMAQVLAPVLNLNKTLAVKAEFQIENILLFVTFFTIVLLIRKDNDKLLSIAKSEADKVKKSQKNYRDLFESSMDAILLIDKNLKCIDCNQAALKLFYIDSKKKISKMDLKRLSAEKQGDGSASAAVLEKIRGKTFTHGSQSFEWRHRRSDGEEFDAQVLLTNVKFGNKNLIQATVRDITHQKKSQEMLVQSEKMMSIGGLAAGMAHEINNPLAGVIQNANVLTNRLTDTAMQANLKAAETLGISMTHIRQFMEARGIPKMLKAINESVLRISSLVDNMLSFARKSEATFSTHQPADLMEKALELAVTDYDLKKEYDFKAITIQKEYNDNLPMVACEGSKIQQVLLNIFSNGAHAMFEGERKSDAPDPKFILRLSHKKDIHMLQIEIEDNGIGMNKETLDKIFEPFYTTKPDGVGTGLGLSVSYFIITQNHKGTIEAFSKPGKGCNFIIRLPLESKGRESDPEE